MTREKILDFLQDCQFDGEITTDDFEYKVIENLPSSFKYGYAYGVSKGVLLPENEDHVIKIPFNGFIESIAEEDDDGNYYWHEEFSEHENACDDLDAYWDYCYAEALVYERAKENHVEFAFCPTTYIGSVQGHPIYAQPRVETYYEHYDEDFKYPKERTDKTLKVLGEQHLYKFNLVWQTDALEYYGEEKFKQLTKFITDQSIGDLHSGNLGYDTGAPVIFDYSGYQS